MKMVGWTSAAPSVLASFMASTVEFVEALTIVLAVGAVRGWRSALLGTGAAFLVLIALVGMLGPMLTRIPLPVVQLVVGTLLLLFGLRWLRKAILRAAGVLALHDETKAFEAETASLRNQASAGRQSIDVVAFGTAFKIVMLEGIEVVFIVIAIGASGRMLFPAIVGAGLALAVVILLGLAVHRPLSRVPENTLKFGVGVMLAAFGTFWVGEGIGVAWPGADWAILALIGVFLVIAIGLVPVCAKSRPRSLAKAYPGASVSSSVKPGLLGLIGRELVGLFVDDAWLAGGIVACVGLVWLAEAQWSPLSTGVMGSGFVFGLALVLVASAIRRARS